MAHAQDKHPAPVTDPELGVDSDSDDNSLIYETERGSAFWWWREPQVILPDSTWCASLGEISHHDLGLEGACDMCHLPSSRYSYFWYFLVFASLWNAILEPVRMAFTSGGEVFGWVAA